MVKEFVSWVKLLYSSPKASVITNRLNSEYFNLHRGTHQGCPLSQLLFALAIEPLSIALKTSPNISGILRWGTEHKVSLYADDLLVYISDPAKSAQALIEILRQFGPFSGHKLNFAKSECFPFNNLATETPEMQLPFHKCNSEFKYLDIYITRKYEHLYDRNFSPLLIKIKEDFDRWKTIYFSLAGRVNAIKMNILPRFLYLFQCLPLFLPKLLFTTLDKLITGFLWGNKLPRINKVMLQRHRTQGGLSLPNFRFYYWAANIQKIMYWIKFPRINWCLIEAYSCPSCSLVF